MRFIARIYWIWKIAIKVAVSKKEDSSLESLLFLEILVKRNILVLLVFLLITMFLLLYFCFKLSYTGYMLVDSCKNSSEIGKF